MPSFEEILPTRVLSLLRTRLCAEFATVSVAGFPIDTPTFVFPDAGLQTLDIGTGVAYPAKAERARRNPRVGMLLEGNADDPVISLAGYAAVRDADIQANLERYLAETIFAPNVDPAIVPWEHTRQRLYYVSRIIVAVAPTHVRWWPNRAALDQEPDEWHAPPGTLFPHSDPAPAEPASKAPGWKERPWKELAHRALASGLPAHLTLIDEGGFPMPFRARACDGTETGFRLDIPCGAPWSEGKASLSFAGREIFLGEARSLGSEFDFRVERVLPVLPMMEDRENLPAEALEALNGRLAAEMRRRGLPLPVVPETPPEPTEGARIRAGASRGAAIGVDAAAPHSE